MAKMDNAFVPSEPVGVTNEPDSPVVESEGAVRPCYWQGKEYSFGQSVCINGRVANCNLDGTWRLTSTPCR